VFSLSLEILQVEVTSKCNFNCKYCLRQFWRSSPRDLRLEIFEKILENFPSKKVVLYGFGEPLVHENIRKMAKIASENSEVVLVTNGSLEVERVLNYVDFLGISLDSIDPEFLKRVRVNSEFEVIAENIKKAKERVEVELEVVLMQDNIKELTNFIKWAGDLGVDVSISNLVPYSREMYEMGVFVEFSKRTLEIYRDVIKEYPKKDRFLIDVALGVKDAVEIYRRIWERVREEGYSINILRLMENERRVKFAERAEKILEECKEISESFGIKLHFPQIFGDDKLRECPYEEGIFVRADGKVAPCMEFAYTHPAYINGHEKKVEEVIIGNSSEFEMEFQKKKRKLKEFMPWCGDCSYVTFCWYVEESRDCYANKPSCSECLYSAKISRCIL